MANQVQCRKRSTKGNGSSGGRERWVTVEVSSRTGAVSGNVVWRRKQRFDWSGG